MEAKTQIPIHRAKKIDSDEYVEGFYIPPNPDMEDGIVTFEQTPMCMDTGHVDVYTETHKIDPSTLAIHFPDMIDSEGTKIFAGLSEDGKGGDVLEFPHHKETMKYSKGCIKSGLLDFMSIKSISRWFKVTGIQQ